MMQNLRFVLVLGVAAVLLESCVVREGDRFVSCGRNHRLEVVDLDIAPDPIAERERVDQWRVRLRADASGECQTTIRVYESGGNELVAQEKVFRLRPGNNDIVLDPFERYRFTRNEHCFQVIADIEGTRRPIDAARRFCAKQIAGRRWTMR